jgi:hypothetical protein
MDRESNKQLDREPARAGTVSAYVSSDARG